MEAAQPFWPFAHELADVADAIQRQYFRQDVGLTWKEDATPVTKADQAIERALRDRIMASFPTHGIYGEEEERHQPEAAWQWVLDPIDGTRSFTAGKPQFMTLIALCHQGIPMLGIASQGILRERYSGQTGVGSWRSVGGEAPEPITTRPCPSWQKAWLATTSPHYFSDEGKKFYSSLQSQAKETIYGGDAYNYCLLAAGGLDAVVEEGLKPYDILALVPIITAAGGKVLGWQGEEVTIATSGKVMAMGDVGLLSAAD